MSAYAARLFRSFAAPVALLSLTFGVAACGGYKATNPSDYGIQSTDLITGNGTELRRGRGATVHYTLWLYDETQPEGKGPQLQTSIGGTPVSFAPLGYGQVISGWDVGLDGMKVGGTRRLVIPPDYAYGAGGSGQIPGNATLLFEIQLVGVY